MRIIGQNRTLRRVQGKLLPTIRYAIMTKVGTFFRRIGAWALRRSTSNKDIADKLKAETPADWLSRAMVANSPTGMMLSIYPTGYNPKNGKFEKMVVEVKSSDGIDSLEPSTLIIYSERIPMDVVREYGDTMLMHALSWGVSRHNLAMASDIADDQLDDIYYQLKLMKSDADTNDR